MKHLITFLVLFTATNFVLSYGCARVSKTGKGKDLSILQMSRHSDGSIKVDEKKAESTKSINNISIEVISTDVNIVATDGDKIEVELKGAVSKNYFEEVESNKLLEIIRNGDNLSVKIKRKNSKWSFWSSVKRFELVMDIKCPKKLFSKLNVSSVSGDIDAKGLNTKLLKMDSVSGEITLKHLSANETRLNSVSGDVDISFLKNGEIRINTVSGEIKTAITTLTKDFYAETVSGDVEIKVPAKPNFNLDIETVSGDIDLGIPVLVKGSQSKGEMKGTVGSGGGRFNIETVSGDINIEKL